MTTIYRILLTKGRASQVTDRVFMTKTEAVDFAKRIKPTMERQGYRVGIQTKTLKTVRTKQERV